MSLFKKWEEIANQERTQEEYNNFWGEYLPQEQEIYEQLLENFESVEEGTIEALAKKYEIDMITFVGFLDGINDSLNQSIDLSSLTEESTISLDINFEKLYYNMHDANAQWLYNLPQWENILTKDERKRIKKEYNKTRIVVNKNKVGRNDPCPCGSGKKYKKCCLNQ